MRTAISLRLMISPLRQNGMFLPYISILKFDVRNYTLAQIKAYLKVRKHLTGHIKYLAEKLRLKRNSTNTETRDFPFFRAIFLPSGGH